MKTEKEIKKQIKRLQKKHKVTFIAKYGERAKPRHYQRRGFISVGINA